MNNNDLINEITLIKNSILNSEKININNKKLMDIYTYVYICCTNDKTSEKKKAFELFDIYENSIRNFIEDSDIYLQNDFTIDNSIIFINKFLFFCKNLNFMFRYLNKYFIIKYKNIELHSKSIDIFKEILFEKIDNNCSGEILNEIDNYFITKNELLKNILKLYGFYKKLNFDPINIVLSIKNGYKSHLLKKIHLSNFEEILLFYNNQYKSILYLCDQIQICFLIKDLTNILIDCLSNLNIHMIIKSSFSKYFLEKQIEHLDFIHKINPRLFFECLNSEFENINTFNNICLYYQYICELTKILNDEKIELKYTEYISNLFRNNENMIKNLAKEIMINHKGYFILKLIDNKEDVIIQLGRTIVNKLIHNDFYDLDLEIKSINEMKNYLDHSLTFKLKNLLMDIKNSFILTRTFENNNTNIYIFSNKLFLSDPISDFIYNHYEFDKIKHNITHYYKKQFSNRILRFNYWQTTVFFDYYINNKIYNIIMPIIQFFIFEIIFNNKSINYKDIHSKISIPSYIFNGLLHSLTHKFSIINKTGDKHKINIENDIFSINYNFSSLDKNIKFVLPLFNKNKPNTEYDKENIHFLRAKIMNIIKTSSPISLSQLLTKMITFTKNEILILQQLEYLIDQEYIELQNDFYIYIP
jgi:hypothetical protein